MFSTKTSAAGLSIFSNIFVILIEGGACLATGSISILAGVADSVLNLFAAVIAYFTVRAAERPADEEHPFGHGKMESLGGVMEGVLIFIAAALIFQQAVKRLMVGAVIGMEGLGIGAMLLSIGVNFLVSRQLFKVAKATDSVALEGDARNLIADIYSSVGIILGLAAVWLTGLMLLDSVVALGVVLLILRSAFGITKQSIQGLIDARLPVPEEERIKSTISRHCGRLLQMPEFLAEVGVTSPEGCHEIASFHKLRTRKSGAERHIDLHLVVAKSVSVEQAHRICNHLEKDMKQHLPISNITIHIEPCDGKCDACAISLEKSPPQ